MRSPDARWCTLERFSGMTSATDGVHYVPAALTPDYPLGLLVIQNGEAPEPEDTGDVRVTNSTVRAVQVRELLDALLALLPWRFSFRAGTGFRGRSQADHATDPAAGSSTVEASARFCRWTRLRRYGVMQAMTFVGRPTPRCRRRLDDGAICRRIIDDGARPGPRLPASPRTSGCFCRSVPCCVAAV